VTPIIYSGIKIGDLNKVFQRINTETKKLAYNLKDWDKITVRKLIDLLEDSEDC
jgi:hypothetical protein